MLCSNKALPGSSQNTEKLSTDDSELELFREEDPAQYSAGWERAVKFLGSPGSRTRTGIPGTAAHVPEPGARSSHVPPTASCPELPKAKGPWTAGAGHPGQDTQPGLSQARTGSFTRPKPRSQQLPGAVREAGVHLAGKPTHHGMLCSLRAPQGPCVCPPAAG